MPIKEYLGDSVYAEFHDDTSDIILYTDNGFGPREIITLEPEVVAAFDRFRERLGRRGGSEWRPY